ncbi:MAG: hypothetical protein LBT44_08540 [Clostridiales bacterium]|nr:hypothetical protein [Clostridiales bacterium]
MKKMIAAVLCLMLVLIATACADTSNPEQNTSTSEPPETSPAAQLPETADENITLYLGMPDGLKQVETTIPAFAADAMISAISDETGWNLILALPVDEGEIPGSAVVSLSEDSTVYIGPPEIQKDAYHVFDTNELVFTVLNSIAETLTRNGLTAVYFTAPDGIADLDFTEGGITFHFSAATPWDFDAVYADNFKDEGGEVYVTADDSPIIQTAATILMLNLAGFTYAENGKVTNEYAVYYLYNLANLFFADRAEVFPDIISDFDSYIYFPQKEADELLNFAFGGGFSTAELSTDPFADSQLIIYNAEAYFIGLGDVERRVSLTQLESASAYSYLYQYTVSQIAAEDITGTLEINFEPSDNNPIGLSVTSVQITK